jgi:hypothetical protein
MFRWDIRPDRTEHLTVLVAAYDQLPQRLEVLLLVLAFRDQLDSRGTLDGYFHRIAPYLLFELPKIINTSIFHIILFYTLRQYGSKKIPEPEPTGGMDKFLFVHGG